MNSMSANSHHTATGRPTTALAVALVSALAVIFFVLLAPTPASAAQYSVYSCSGPLGEPLPNNAWTPFVSSGGDAANFSFNSSCGHIGVSADGSSALAAGERAGWVFEAPDGTVATGFSLDRFAAFARTAATPPLAAGIHETMAASSRDVDCTATDTALNCQRNGVISHSGGDHLMVALDISVYCGASSGCPAGSFSQLETQMSRARVDVEDAQAPTITSVSGTLPDSYAVAGPQSLAVTAADVGGGIAEVMLTIDGVPAGQAAAGGSCAKPYTEEQPCPSSLAHNFNVDTTTLAAGLHSGSVVATDAAGNVSAPHTFHFAVVQPATPPADVTPTNGSPAVADPVIRFEKRTVTVGSRKLVAIRGRVLTASGAPVAGATLEISALDLGVFNATPRPAGTITTNADGWFSVRVRPSGAQRWAVDFRPNAGAGVTGVASMTVRERLKVSAKRSRARVRPGGRLRITGKLSGAGAAAARTPVEIDVRINKRWRAVGVVDTRKGGRYVWNYRFTRVRKPTRFVFRTVVRSNSAWPWSSVKSKSVKVLVAR